MSSQRWVKGEWPAPRYGKYCLGQRNRPGALHLGETRASRFLPHRALCGSADLVPALQRPGPLEGEGCVLPNTAPSPLSPEH